MYDRTRVTLNISSSSVRLLSVEGRQVRKWGSVPLPPGLVKDGLILRPKVVGAVISALFKSAEVPKQRVITSLTGLSFIYRILSLPRMEANSQKEAIQRAARKEMLLPLEELYLSWLAINGGQDELDFFVLGVPRHPIDALVQTLDEAGVKPYQADLNPLALARAANRKEAIIVALEPDCFDIVLVTDGLPAVMHAITPRGERASITDNVRRLIDELSKTVEFYNSNHPQNHLSPSTPLLLTGELAADAATGELISSETGYPVEPLVTPLSLPQDLPAASFATNLGLALKKSPPRPATPGDQTLFRDINLNILAARYKPSVYRLKPLPVILSLVVIIGLGLLPMNHLRSQVHTETGLLQNDLTGVRQKLDQAQLSLDKAKQLEVAIDKILANAETLKQSQQSLLSKGGDFARNLELVTDAFPPTAYFTSVEIGADQITVAGEADSPFTIVNYVFALEALGKFSEVRIVRIYDIQSAGGGTPGAGSNRVSFELVISQ